MPPHDQIGEERTGDRSLWQRLVFGGQARQDAGDFAREPKKSLPDTYLRGAPFNSCVFRTNAATD